jgi:acyl dehydratase
MNLDHVTARRFQPIEQSYDWRDAALYAISLGIGDDPLDEDELPYVYEGRDQLAMPSMCVTLGWPPLWIAESETGIAWHQVLHGEQRFELHRPLATKGEIQATYRVSAVADKGPGRGALLYFDTELRDATTGENVASLHATNVLRGDGGCGDYGTPPAALAPLPDVKAADDRIDYRTGRQAALLYRLASHDYMPLHADPLIARDAGFDAPISHGLNTMGLACRAILKRFAPRRPERLRAMAARFVAPAFPGDTIRIEMFGGNDRVRFRAFAIERQTLVLDRGDCRLNRD